MKLMIAVLMLLPMLIGLPFPTKAVELNLA